MQAGMIGLGAMGAHMARNLAKAGFLKIVWNRTAAKACQLAEELHVSAAETPAILATHADIILICVSADRYVLDIIKALTSTIRPGTVVVDMSTISNSTAKQVAAILEDKQAEFMDAPVSGGVEGAKKGTLAMMLGGKSSTLEKVRPVLATMTSRMIHMGSVGSGQSTKAVNQAMAAGINQAVSEALAFAEALELPMNKVIEVISAGAAGNWFMQHRGPSMIAGTFTPGFKLALHHKDLKICQTMASENGISTKLVDMTVADYEKLMADNLGDEDISALYRLKRLR